MRIADHDQQIHVFQIQNRLLADAGCLADFIRDFRIRILLQTGPDKILHIQLAEGGLIRDQHLTERTKLFQIFRPADQMHALRQTDHTLRFRMMRLADVEDVARTDMLLDQIMCPGHIRTGRIDNLQTLGSGLFIDRITDAMSSQNDYSGIDIIQQFQPGAAGIFQAADAEVLAGLYDMRVMDDHAQHRHRFAGMFLNCFIGNPDRPGNPLAVAAGMNRDDFHVCFLSRAAKSRYNQLAFLILIQVNSMKQFSDFNLRRETMAFIRASGFKEPTPVQERVIPYAVKGKDVVGISRTGTGKTHAYLIPILEKADPSADHVQAVITAPTRELAYQIFEKSKAMAEALPGLRIRLYIGGRDRKKEIEQLQASQPHIVIGTPGRIRDLFLKEGALRLDGTGMLVIDEADMTLEYGFLKDIDEFAGRMGEHLQMLVFSATIPPQLQPFLKKYMHHPITIRIEEQERFNPQIRHILVPCYHHSYEEVILKMLPGFRPYVCLIFANTRTEAAAIAKALREHGVPVTELHGDLESRKRKQAMKEFMHSEKPYVVATDLAARGMDVNTVTHVISCGFPSDLSFYIHRAGRASRAGASGTCYALYREEDDAAIRSLMKQGIRFEHMRYRSDGWQTLRPYGQKRQKPDTEMEKKISMMMTKKNTRVKPGYKKKRQAAIEKLERQKKREFIRAKIKEERTARYKQQTRDRKAGKDQ